MSIRTRSDRVCSHTTPCSLSRRNAVCPRAGVVAVAAAAGVGSKLDFSLLMVLVRDGAVLDGAREAEAEEDDDEEEEDEVEDAEEEVF